MKRTFFLPVTLLLALLFVTVACENDDDNDPICEAFESPDCPSLIFTACSDGDRDYLEYNDKKYYCESEGIDPCEDAAQEIISEAECTAPSAAMLKSGSSHEYFVLGAIAKVRAEARAAAGCN